MCRQQTPWEKCVEFHGHVCPGLVLGYKVAFIGLGQLGLEKAEDEELVVIVENSSCAVDAIQVLTGCTFGKGNLVHRDYGKQVYTLGNRRTGEAVRIAVKPLGIEREPQDLEIQDRIAEGTATKDEKRTYWKKQNEIAQKIIDISDEDFCSVSRIPLDLPKRARVENTLICQGCGEGVMESKAQQVEGKLLCPACLNS